MVTLATVPSEKFKTAVEILALFHISITTTSIQPLWPPPRQNIVNGFGGCTLFLSQRK